MSNKELLPKTPGQFRRKAAAWTAGLSLFGGMAAAETANPEPATASADLIAKHNEQAGVGAQEFITSFDKKLAKTVAEMPSSSYFSSLHHAALSKALHADITIEYVGAPSKKYPGRYDILAVTMRKGQAIPLNASINLGADSKQYAKMKDYKFGYLFAQVSNSGNIMPHSMLVSTDEGSSKIDTLTYFEVSSEGYPSATLPPDGVKYSKNPSQVSTQFNAFLNQAESIVTRK